MKILTYFILGIIFIQWCVPIGDSLTELIVTVIEMLKGKLGLSITKSNVAIKKLTDDVTETEEHLIGFQIDPVEYEEEEEEDDEYDD